MVDPPRFVSRGGEKLENGLETFGIDVAAELCLDVGASTGGFTDCLLAHGAARVIAVDVGRNQLHERIASDPRVTVIDRYNARNLKVEDLPFRPTFVTADVSFISLRLVLPAVFDVARGSPGAGWCCANRSSKPVVNRCEKASCGIPRCTGKCYSTFAPS